MIFQLGGVHGNGNVRTVQDVFSMDIQDLRFCYIVASFKIDQFFIKSGAHIHNIFILALFASTFMKIHIKRLWVASFKIVQNKKVHKTPWAKIHNIAIFNGFFFFVFFFTRIITDIMSARIFSNGRRNVGKIKHRKTLQKVIILQYLNSLSSFSIDILETAS